MHHGYITLNTIHGDKIYQFPKFEDLSGLLAEIAQIPFLRFEENRKILASKMSWNQCKKLGMNCLVVVMNKIEPRFSEKLYVIINKSTHNISKDSIRHEEGET